MATESKPWVRLTNLGIEVLREDVTLEEYAQENQIVAEITRSTPWVIGALVNYGLQHFGEEAPGAWNCYEDYQAQTLTNYASVERRVPIENRRSDLSWGHHQAVASFPVTAQKKLLAVAAEKGLRRKEFREFLLLERGMIPPAVTPDPGEVEETADVILERVMQDIDKLVAKDPGRFLNAAKVAKDAFFAAVRKLGGATA